MRNNLKMYQKVNVDSTLEAADPHTVILMLFDGVLQSISIAKGAIERKDLSAKGQSVTKAVNILRSLQGSLDHDSQPEISKNFDVLYSYCIDLLMDGSVSLNLTSFDEAVELLKPIRDAWKSMPENGKQEGMVLLSQKNQNQSSQVGM